MDGAVRPGGHARSMARRAVIRGSPPRLGYGPSTGSGPGPLGWTAVRASGIDRISRLVAAPSAPVSRALGPEGGPQIPSDSPGFSGLSHCPKPSPGCWGRDPDKCSLRVMPEFILSPTSRTYRPAPEATHRRRTPGGIRPTSTFYSRLYFLHVFARGAWKSCADPTAKVR